MHPDRPEDRKLSVKLACFVANLAPETEDCSPPTQTLNAELSNTAAAHMVPQRLEIEEGILENSWDWLTDHAQV